MKDIDFRLFFSDPLDPAKWVGSKVSDELAVVLAEELKTNATLTSLVFSGDDGSESCIGWRGAAALAAALKMNSSLISLDISNNHICDQGAAELAKALQTNHTLTSLILHGNHFNDISWARALSEALKISHTLTFLDVSDCNLMDPGTLLLAEALKVNTTLASLNLSNNPIDSEGAVALAEALTVNQTLTFLDLLKVTYCDEWANTFCEALKTNQTLTSLKILGSFAMADALADVLTCTKTLTSLEVSETYGNGTVVLAQATKSNQSLTSLNLVDYFSSTVGLPCVMAEVLSLNETLTSLTLVCCNPFHGRGNKDFIGALEKNRSLISLEFHGENFGDPGAVALAEVLVRNETLTSVNISSCGIGDNGALALATMLCTNTTLASLRISGSVSYRAGTACPDNLLPGGHIGDAGAGALARALAVNGTLTSLSVAGHKFQDDGTAAFADSLLVNSALVSLDLSDNRLGDVGAVALTEALKKNKTLTFLDIQNCGLSTSSIKVLIQMLVTSLSYVLQLTFVLREKLSSDVLLHSLDYLPVNRGLKKLKVMQNTGEDAREKQEAVSSAIAGRDRVLQLLGGHL